MKAIKIPNIALLDVFGRTVATNSHDFHRLSRSDHHHHHENNGKSSNAIVSGVKLEHPDQLTVIGSFGESGGRKLGIFLLGETPLHIAIFYNDISSVQLLVKHGVDVNQRVIDSFHPSGLHRSKSETKNGRRNRTSTFFVGHYPSQKVIRLKNANPESKLRISNESPIVGVIF